MASISGVINAINKLSKPLQKKVAKKLGIDVEGKPGRKTDSIIVGTDRVSAERKINRLRQKHLQLKQKRRHHQS